ncbi:hypothetical protein BCR34DRAFT_563589 [Clohesyomyces aquaticus]|uniref:Uncharacterized protein n=1 Tax=Clohesyomyces aquaticus TaxID=1231657 RepID=A0A1Y1ZQI7_9PLEO|nr:hypothetical protein BCR34DRAFT_563589 [Clohesyomyces aquaticus]
MFDVHKHPYLHTQHIHTSAEAYPIPSPTHAIILLHIPRSLYSVAHPYPPLSSMTYIPLIPAF